ncbi:hypothetical protein BsWGS_16970 [Bradybaena similaris]
MPPRQGEHGESRSRRPPPPLPPLFPKDSSTSLPVEPGNIRPPLPSREGRPSQSSSLRSDSSILHAPQRPPPRPPGIFPGSPSASSIGYGSLESSRDHHQYRSIDIPLKTPQSGVPLPPEERTSYSDQVFFPTAFSTPSPEFKKKGSPSSLQDDSTANAMYSSGYYPPRDRKDPPLSPSARPIHRPLVTTPRSVESAAEEDSLEAEGAQTLAGNTQSFLHLVGKSTGDAKVEPEEYFQTDTVLGLNSLNFDGFIKKHNKTLVMFFDSLKTDSFLPSKEFAAASIKARHTQNHVFAAVDCHVEGKLCCRENVKQLPSLKLYSNGFLVSSLSVLKDFGSDQMNMLMTMAPVLTQPRR